MEWASLSKFTHVEIEAPYQACFDLILCASILKAYIGEIKQSLP